jgi:DNA-binding NarL/FixJ family response regulator
MKKETTARSIRVLLADDHAMIREGLAQLLEDSENILVVGQAGNGEEAVSLAKKMKPDVAVLDYSMPNMDGPLAAREIRAACPDVKILVLTVHENVHYAIKALEAGAHGFILKAAAAGELVKGIRSVFKGRTYVSPSIADKITESNIRGKRKRSGLASLSQREFELVRLLGSGLKLQDCAKTMNVTESTASTYRTRLMEKLNLKTTAEIIRFALENGIIG